MFKRKAEGGGDESSSKKNQGADTTVAPIPRHIPTQSVTLNFVQRTWETIAPGILYYIPLCQTPKYMFDAASIKQLKRFKNLWGTMEIHNPHVKFSNLIMLQDDLRVQNNTPTDATAFTQVVYLAKYCPKAQKEFFRLGTVKNDNVTLSDPITYLIDPIKTVADKPPSRLVQLQGYESFDTLAIHPAKANLTAGFVPGANVTIQPNDYRVLDPYVPPNAPNTPFAYFSGNLNNVDDSYIPSGSSVTLARNQDSIQFYKYGDVFSVPINTNLNGVHLVNHIANDFLETQTIDIKSDTITATYEGEFCWPGRNRPFFHRGNYYDPSTDPITQGKSLKPLSHCFLTMPPIRKPNEAMLGQRCSMLMEQHISLTFHMTQATFMDDDEENAQQMNQDNAVILRRNFYPVPDIKKTGFSPFCSTDGCDIECDTTISKKVKQAPCKYENNWEGFTQFVSDTTKEKVINNDLWIIDRQFSSDNLYTHTSKDPVPVPLKTVDLFSDQAFRDFYEEKVKKGEKQLFIDYTNAPKVGNYIQLFLENDMNILYDPTTNKRYLEFYVDGLDAQLKKYNIKCVCPKKIQKAVTNKVCNTFFM